jgi:hypothetical protein
MSVLKFKHFCGIGKLIAVTVIPAVLMFFIGKKMQDDESLDEFMKRRKAERVNME